MFAHQYKGIPVPIFSVTTDEHRLIRFLTALRNSHPDMQELFMRGQCYNLWLIVRTVFPEVQCMHSYSKGHIYIGYKGSIYDIRGKCLRPPSDIKQLDHKVGNGDRPHRWCGRDTRHLTGIGMKKQQTDTDMKDESPIRHIKQL